MRFLLPLALAAVLVAGCGSDEDDSATTPSANPSAAQSTPEGGAAAEGEGDGGGEVVEVAMRDIQFDPQSITVQVGQTVRWTNEDDVEHDADATSGADFESELYGKGGTQDWKAEEPGTVEYVCSVHPNMRGTITVE